MYSSRISSACNVQMHAPVIGRKSDKTLTQQQSKRNEINIKGKIV